MFPRQQISKGETRVDKLVFHHLRLPLVHPFETSFGRVTEQETIIVEAHAAGIVGYGESPASAAPFYSAETVKTCLHVATDFLAPMLFEEQKGRTLSRAGRAAASKGRDLRRASSPSSTGVPPVKNHGQDAHAGFRGRGTDRLAVGPHELPAIFSRVRGHNMAKAGIEAAVWHLKAQLESVSLARLYGGVRKRIAAGVSLGIERTVEALLARIELFVSRGYRRIKLKIKPGWDVQVLEQVRKRFPAVPLMVDANSAYTLRDVVHLKKLDKYRLMMIEEPLGWDDIVDHARLQREIRTPICLDESIHSPDDARKAIELGACRIINIKPARVGGPTMARRVHDVCRNAGIPVWCGGLLETGIGRAHNIAIASLPGFSLPGDISGSDRYYARDIIEPPVAVSPSGAIEVPQDAGLGFRVLKTRLESYTVQTVLVR